MSMYWVYSGTGIEYQGELPQDLSSNLENYQPTYKKNKLHTIHFNVNGQSITLEQVTAQTLKQRTPHWVYSGTGIEYQGELPQDLYLNLESYQPTYKKNKLHTINVIFNGQSITLEQVTATALKKRAPRWVYSGTGIEYQGELPQDLSSNLEYYQPTYKNNKLHTINVIFNGQGITLEQVTVQTLKQRAPHWVYSGTGIEYQGELPQDLSSNLENYQPTYKNNKLHTINVTFNGQSITLEQVTAQTLKKRAPHWVYSGTDIEYLGELPQDLSSNLENYQPTYQNNKLHTIHFNVNGQSITLEQVTATALINRTPHWVYSGTGIEYQGELPRDLYLNLESYQPTYNNNKLHTIHVTFNGQSITLEQVTASVLINRTPHWVYSGTGIEYQGALPQDLYLNLENYQPTYNNNKLHTINVTFNGQSITLEQVTALVLRQRAPRWVYSGTGIEYQGELPQDLYLNLESYQPTYKKNKLHTINVTFNGQSIILEQVTAQTLKRRAPHWVYSGTGIEYQGELPQDLYLNLENYQPTYKKNKLHTICFSLDEQNIILKYVTASELKRQVRSHSNISLEIELSSTFSNQNCFFQPQEKTNDHTADINSLSDFFETDLGNLEAPQMYISNRPSGFSEPPRKKQCHGFNSG